MAKKKSVENKALKVWLIVISVAVTGAAIALVVIYLFAINFSEYIDARMRCGASSIVKGYETPLRHEKLYYPQGDGYNTGHPGLWERYFCSNKEAEDAGYQVYTDLRVN